MSRLSRLVLPVELGQHTYRLAPNRTELVAGNQIIPLPSIAKDFNILTISTNDHISIYVSTIVQAFPRELLKREFNTSFPFFIEHDHEISDSTLDLDYYHPTFERQHQLGLNFDGSSIYLNDESPKFKPVSFARRTEPWRKFTLGWFNLGTSLFFTFLTVFAAFRRKDLQARALRLFHQEQYFISFFCLYALLLFAIFREGIGDWATDWESMYVQVNQLIFSQLYSRLYQLLAYLFYLTSYEARAIACLTLWMACVWYYRLLLRHFVGNRLLAVGLLGLVMFSPVLLINIFHTQRMYFASLFLCLGSLLLYFNLIFKMGDSRYLRASYLALVVAAALRQDFVVFILPLILSQLFWTKLSRKRLLWACVFAAGGYVILSLSHDREFQRSYEVVSYRAAFQPYFKSRESLPPADNAFLNSTTLMNGFMPSVRESEASRFKEIVRRAILNEPLIFITNGLEKMKGILFGQEFYRGLNTTDRGKAYQTKMYDIPEGRRATRGKSVQNFLPLSEGEKITTILPMPKEVKKSDDSLLMVTRAGVAKNAKRPVSPMCAFPVLSPSHSTRATSSFRLRSSARATPT